MAEPFLSEIRIMSFGFPPKGWATCDGQLLPINQNQALFSLLGTTYGGDGRVNFGLPNLHGRTPMHMGNGHVARRARRRAGSHALDLGDTDAYPYGARPLRPTAIRSSRRIITSDRSNQLYGAPANLTSLTPADDQQRRRQPGASQHAAVSDPQLQHRPAGHLPVADLRKPIHGTALCGRNSHVRRQFCAGRLDVLRGTAPADLRIRNPFQPDRHHLWRRRPEHVRAAGPARPRFRSIRATASRWPRPAAPRRSR